MTPRTTYVKRADRLKTNSTPQDAEGSDPSLLSTPLYAYIYPQNPRARERPKLVATLSFLDVSWACRHLLVTAHLLHALVSTPDPARRRE